MQLYHLNFLVHALVDKGFCNNLTLHIHKRLDCKTNSLFCKINIEPEGISSLARNFLIRKKTLEGAKQGEKL